ncbi:MAG: heavy metal-binding domain-containing protein [Flavobacteriales bacterium]
MKAIQVLMTATVISTTMFFTACSGSNQGESQEHMEGEVAAYYCPMECEGDKTYSEEGTCPVCGMDLVVKSE